MSRIVVLKDFEKENKRGVEYMAYLTPAMRRLGKRAFRVRGVSHGHLVLENCPVENVVWSADMYYESVTPV